MHKKRPKQISLGVQSRKHLIIPKGRRLRKVRRKETVNQDVEDKILPSGNLRREIWEGHDKGKRSKKDK